LKALKTFLGYLSALILGQRVDALGLSTAAKKIEAITKLDFLKSLKELETYIGLTG